MSVRQKLFTLVVLAAPVAHAAVEPNPATCQVKNSKSIQYNANSEPSGFQTEIIDKFEWDGTEAGCTDYKICGFHENEGQGWANNENAYFQYEMPVANNCLGDSNFERLFEYTAMKYAITCEDPDGDGIDNPVVCGKHQECTSYNNIYECRCKEGYQYSVEDSTLVCRPYTCEDTNGDGSNVAHECDKENEICKNFGNLGYACIMMEVSATTPAPAPTPTPTPAPAAGTTINSNDAATRSAATITFVGAVLTSLIVS